MLRLGGLGFADALLQALFPAVTFALKFLVPFSFLVSHGFLLETDDFRVTRVAHTATFVKGRPPSYPAHWTTSSAGRRVLGLGSFFRYPKAMRQATP